MEWISVDTELPEHGKDVLTWNGSCVEMSFWWKGENAFLSLLAHKPSTPLDNVTHWAYLPEPPSGNKPANH